MQAPVLVRRPVRLRPHEPGDVEGLHRLFADRETGRWVDVPRPYPLEAVRARVDEQARRWSAGDGERALVVTLDGRFAGEVGLRVDARAADLGFALLPEHRGAGVMSRALRLYLGWAFEHLDVDVVHCRTLVGNWACRRVLWACGFAVEGHVRGLVDRRGLRRDGWVASLRRGDRMLPRHPWLDVPELDGPRVHLRPNRPGDAPRIVDACNAPSTRSWLPMLPFPYTADDARTYLDERPEQEASGRGVYWAVTAPDDDVLQGQIGLMSLDRGVGEGEIGYWVHPDARGRGIGRGAVRTVARHALLPAEDGGLGLERLLIRVAEDNVASRRVAEAAGFTLVGRDRRGELLRDGRRRDMLRYDLLAHELADSLAHPSALR